jgi:hypothetical protein
MAAAYIVNTPPQIPADAMPPATLTRDSAGKITTTHTLKKITAGGSDGSMTIVDGKVTSYTAPT